jgi:hypothetical protein
MADLPYNPQKAHEYYLRTRQLKGRATGVIKPPAPVNKTAIARATAVKKAVVAKPKVKTRAQHRREVEAQVAAFENRIARLRETLQAMVAAAKARSGVKPTSTPAAKSSSQSTTAKGGSSSKLTAKQKADAAKRAKAYYEKHKGDTPEKQLADLKAKVVDLEAKIKEFKAQADAAASARKKHGGSVGVSSKTINGRSRSK